MAASPWRLSSLSRNMPACAIQLSRSGKRLQNHSWGELLLFQTLQNTVPFHWCHVTIENEHSRHVTPARMSDMNITHSTQPAVKALHLICGSDRSPGIRLASVMKSGKRLSTVREERAREFARKRRKCRCGCSGLLES